MSARRKGAHAKHPHGAEYRGPGVADGDYRCHCCRRGLYGSPMADGDDLCLDVCPTCDAAFGQSAYVAALLQRKAGMTVLTAIHVAQSLGEDARTALLRSVSKRETRKARRMTRLLLIDDDAAILSTYRRVLGERYEVTTALGGAEGIARMRAASFDVILSDVSMPDVDGAAVYAEARRLDLAARAIFWSGSWPADFAALLDAVRVPRLNKPCNATALWEAIGSRICAAKARRP